MTKNLEEEIEYLEGEIREVEYMLIQDQKYLAKLHNQMHDLKVRRKMEEIVKIPAN